MSVGMVPEGGGAGGEEMALLQRQRQSLEAERQALKLQVGFGAIERPQHTVLTCGTLSFTPRLSSDQAAD